MDAEVAKVIRGLGVVLVLFSLLMLALQLAWGAFMLWMDVPMLLIGVGMVVYGHAQLRRAGPPPT